MAYAIIGTAGHIDHGKTSLVRSLTGINTDRLAEEQRRGMTLDLGFTWFDVNEHRLAVIDVPGHEKYIANMLAGVAALDIGMLVVAADEGVALQTREHLAILTSLAVPRLIVVMTKADLSDEITMEIIEEDLCELTGQAGYSEVTIHRVSSKTGEGIEQLRQTLRSLTAEIRRSEPSGPFRMPIDRSFSVPGRGCVVAGTVWQGRVRNGDQLQVLPGGRVVRVRDVEVHGDSVDAAQAGFRTALNLAGVSHTEVIRGCELVAIDSYKASNRCIAEIRMYDDAPEIVNGRIVRLHTAAGSREVKVLTGGGSLLPGEKTAVVLKCEQPVLLTPDQPLLLRRPGASGTFAGGRVLASSRIHDQRTGVLVEFGRRLATHPTSVLETWLDLCGHVDLSDPAVAMDMGITSTALKEYCRDGEQNGTIYRVPESSIVVSSRGRESLSRAIVQRLEARSQDGKAVWTDEASLRDELHEVAPDAMIRWLLQEQINLGHVIQLNRQITAASAMNLSMSQQLIFTRLLKRYHEERRPPNAAGLSELENKPRKELDSLIKLAVSQGMLLNLGGGWFLTPAVVEDLKQQLRELFSVRSELTVAAIRDHWGLTRKHVVPFLEYFDSSGFTCRTDNHRTAGPNLG
ncbi:MAG: selenocysteine-specific translation elongation factor [Fuerstiella sp.]|nr:selenocysteine-specific translation elongation factor [Fuerstiella sp.]